MVAGDGDGQPLGTAGEHLLRTLVPQVLAAVARRHGDFAAAEDAVQEALLVAATRWPREGLPENPRAWLIQVAARRLTDQLRAESARRRRENSALQQALAEEATQPHPADQLAGGHDPERDDTLLLLFTCCHPALSRQASIALTLRAVGGLTTAEIAHAYLVPEATMAQRISRAKQTIRRAGQRFELPSTNERAARLDAVLHVLYLIFNEGYAASSGGELMRIDLAREAIRLGRLLVTDLPNHPEAGGLLALMLLTDARRAARTGDVGELIPLDEQDRSRWDREVIREGTALVEQALSRGEVGPFQLQAAIAALHDAAERVEDTDWPQILALYGLLERMSDNPMVRLNRAVAAAMVHGPEVGLRLLDALGADPRLAGHHRLAAVRAHLHERAGDHRTAVAGYQQAAVLTSNLSERNYLLMRIARLRAP